MSGVHEDAMSSTMNLVNPFPDYVPKRTGWPDTKSSGSVVLVDLWEQVVKQPDGLSAGDTWDCHVSLLPQAYRSVTNVLSMGTTYTIGATGSALDSVNIQTYKSGLYPDVLAGENIAHAYSYGNLTETHAFRIVAQGLEIVNTSAELYRGGTSCAYRYASPYGSTSAFTVTSAGTAGSASGVVGLWDVGYRPPAAIADVTNFNNTFIGDAKDGLYVINTPLSHENDVLSIQGRGVAYSKQPGAPGGTAVACANSGGSTRWCMAGGFMSGLAQNSSLLVKHRIYIEIFPVKWTGETTVSPLLRLVNPVTPYSAAAMEMLASVLRDMPAGCPYTENPLGEWFASILDKISTWAPHVGSALSVINPAFGLIGDGVGVGAKGLRKLIKKDVKEAVTQQANNAVSTYVAKNRFAHQTK